MSTSDAFVDASLSLAGLDLDQSAVERIKIEFARIAEIAAVLDLDTLADHIEPASTYRL